MKQLTKNLLIAFVATFFLFSCTGDPTASNPDIAEMSDAGKKAMDEASKSLCTCLNEHGDGLKEFTKEMNTIAAEIEKAEDKEGEKAAISKMMGAMGKMKAFGECMDKAKPSGEAEKAIEAAMKKIIGEDANRKARNKKTFELLATFLDKNCASNAETFKGFISIMEKMDKIDENRKRK